MNLTDGLITIRFYQGILYPLQEHLIWTLTHKQPWPHLSNLTTTRPPLTYCLWEINKFHLAAAHLQIDTRHFHFARALELAPPGACRESISPLRLSRLDGRCPLNWIIAQGMTQAETHRLHNARATVVLFESLRVHLCARWLFLLNACLHLQHTFTSPDVLIQIIFLLSPLYFYSAFLLHSDSALEPAPASVRLNWQWRWKLTHRFINTHGCTNFHK